MEYVKLWLITLFIIHNLIIKIEKKHHIASRVWIDEDENGELMEEDLQESEDEDNDQSGEEEHDHDEDEGDDAATMTPGQHFRRQLLRALEQRGLLA